MILCRYDELNRYTSVIPGLEEAMNTIATITDFTPAVYPFSCGKVLVQKGTTTPLEGAKMEAHRAYLDIQYILEGQEVMGWATIKACDEETPFDETIDAGFYTGAMTPVTVKAGYCYVVFPEDAHAPGKHLTEANDYTKIVVKLAL